MQDNLNLASEKYLTRTRRINIILERMVSLQSKNLPVLVAFMSHPETRMLMSKHGKMWGSLLGQLGEAMQLWAEDVVEITEMIDAAQRD